MTITTTTNRWPYTGDGVTTAFAYESKIISSSDLKVYLDGALQASGYSVSGVGMATGGSVTFSIAPALGVSIVIVREVPATQTSAFADGGPFPAASTENALDKLTILVQQLTSAVGRALRQPESDVADIGRMPDKATRANKFQAFDANGDPIGAAGTSADLGPVSAFINTLLDDANATTALTTLGARGALNHKIYTAGGSFVKANELPAWVTHVFVTCVGGGASGGAGNSSSNIRGTGGSGGSVSRKRIAVAALSASETVNVGNGGAAVAASGTPAAGNNGGASSFGSHCTAGGGVAGSAGVSGAQAGSAGGTATGGDINVPGGDSHTKLTASHDNIFDGRGGAAGLGFGGGGSNVGAAGSGYGGGGAAGNHTPAGALSGAGAGGLVIIEW